MSKDNKENKNKATKNADNQATLVNVDLTSKKATEETKGKTEKTKYEIEKSNFALNLGKEVEGIPDYDTSKNNKKKHHMSAFTKIMFGVVIVGISVFLAMSILFVTQEIFGIRKNDRLVVVDIPEKSGVSDIAEILNDSGVIRSDFIFKAYYKLSKIEGNLNYGFYNLNSNMSYDTIIQELQKYSSTKEEIKVIIPEGFNILEISKRLEESGVCSAKEFIEALQTQNFGLDFEKEVINNPLVYYKLEGYVFPETYNFYKNDNPFNVAKKMVNEFENRVNKSLKTKIEAKGYTVNQALTIASIIQKEAGKTNEMKKVASVYINRLNNTDEFARLQACPTRDYATAIKGEMDVINQDLINAYNTYEGSGLPPGPICNPGLQAIEALLEPEETDYYYFCTNLKTGEFYYAKTLKEHNKNVYTAGLR